MKLLGFIRVSTEGQADVEKGGIDRQKAAIETIARNQGCTVEILPPVTDVSGSNLAASPAWGQVLTRLQSDPQLYLAVDSIDRISRADSLDLAPLVSLRSIRPLIYTTNGPMDLQNPTGSFFAGLLALLGGLEKNQIKARLNGGKEAKRLRGEWVLGTQNLPYGVMYDKDTRSWSYTPEAERVKEAYRLFTVENLSLAEVAKKVGYGDRSTIRIWLQNTIFKGILTYTQKVGDEIYPNSGLDGKQPVKRKVKRPEPLSVRVFPPASQLVTDETWDAANRRLQSLKKHRNKTRAVTSDDAYYSCYLYSALEPLPVKPGARSIHELDMDAEYPRHILYGASRNPTRYVCRCKHSPKNDPHAPKPKCDLPLFHALETNQAIDALLTRLTASTEWLYQKILDSIDNTEKSRDIDAERKQVEKELTATMKKLDRLLDLYLSGDMDKATYQDKNQPLQDRKRGLEARLEKLKTPEAGVDKETLQTHLEGVQFDPAWTPARKRAWLKRYITHISVYPDRVKSVHFRLPGDTPSFCYEDGEGAGWQWVDLIGFDPRETAKRWASKGFYQRGEVAAKLGVNVWQIHDWTNKGLIPPPANTIGRKRLWTQPEIDDLKATLISLGKIPPTP